MTTLPERLAKLKSEIEAGAPPYNFTKEINDTMHRATDELFATGQHTRAKKKGDQAPFFTLVDPDNNPVLLKDMLAKGPLIVTFYRGVWCPYCNMELQALQEALPEIQKRGANIVAISPQTSANSRKSVKQNKLDFLILSDQDGKVAEAFGLRFALPDYLVDLYKSLGNNLALANKDTSWTLPIPARYVIAQDGTIVYSEINPDYTNRPDPSELLPTLDKLTQGIAT